MSFEYKYKKTKRILIDLFVISFFSYSFGVPVLFAYKGRNLFSGGFFIPWCFIWFLCLVLLFANIIGKKRMSTVKISENGITAFCASKNSRFIVSGKVKTVPWKDVIEIESFDSKAPESYPMGGKSGMKLSTENEIILVWSHLIGYEEFCENLLQFRT